MLFTMTSTELNYAEAAGLLPAGMGIEYWWDAVDCDHPGYAALRQYCQQRQRGRLVRLKLKDGTLDPDEIFVHWYNVPEGCGTPFERLEWTSDDPWFDREREGHGEFIHLKRVSIPERDSGRSRRQALEKLIVFSFRGSKSLTVPSLTSTTRFFLQLPLPNS